MALTVSYEPFKMPRGTFGGRRLGILTVTFDDSYPSNGEALTIPGVGSVELFLPGRVSSGYTIALDYSAQKLKAYYADYDAVADGALIEVANGANLSTVTAVGLAICL